MQFWESDLWFISHQRKIICIKLSLDTLKNAEDISSNGSVLIQIHLPNCNYSATSPSYSHVLSFSNSDDESQIHCKKPRFQEDHGNNIEVIIGTPITWFDLTHPEDDKNDYFSWLGIDWASTYFTGAFHDHYKTDSKVCSSFEKVGTGEARIWKNYFNLNHLNSFASGNWKPSAHCKVILKYITMDYIHFNWSVPLRKIITVLSTNIHESPFYKLLYDVCKKNDSVTTYDEAIKLPHSDFKTHTGILLLGLSFLIEINTIHIKTRHFTNICHIFMSNHTAIKCVHFWILRNASLQAYMRTHTSSIPQEYLKPHIWSMLFQIILSHKGNASWKISFSHHVWSAILWGTSTGTTVLAWLQLYPYLNL